MRSFATRGRNAAGEMTLQARDSFARSSIPQASRSSRMLRPRGVSRIGETGESPAPPRTAIRPIVAHRGHDPGEIAAQRVTEDAYRAVPPGAQPVGRPDHVDDSLPERLDGQD